MLVVGAVVGIAALAATGRLRAPAGHRWWLALVAVAAVSAAASSAPFVAFFGAVDRLGGAASWLVCGAAATIGAGVVRRRSDLRVVLRGMSAGAILVTGFVAAQRMGWRFAGSAVSGRPGGPLGNADFLGAFAVLATLVALGASLDRAERPAWRLWHVVATMGAGWCLVVSGTRGAWVGLVAGLVVMAPAGATIAARDRGQAAGVRRALAVVSLLMTALVGVGRLAGAGDRVAEAGASRGTAAGRVATWRRTVDVIAERPVLGWGP
ncbi:MAG: O-antigen ligase family protein, partial [Candidatus Nanopelagicales bacterium]